MDMLTLEQLAEYCRAESTSSKYTEITGISKDNRTVNKGDLFVAIKGDSFDGHNFVKQAAEAGAVAALVNHKIPDADIPQLIVPDTILALGDIAREYRKSLNVKVVGITGSVGKTTTKEMTSCVLSQDFYTHKTIGNLNNEIGLPFSILGLNRSHQTAVIEMGTNHFGEISKLTNIAKPDYALITAIGESHLEYLKTKHGVLKAKLEILEGLRAGGTILLNGDDPLLWEQKGKLGVKTLYFGLANPECDIFGTKLNGDAEKTRFSVRGCECEFEIFCGGVHNMRNALGAIGIGLCFGMSDKKISEGLKTFVNTGMRQKIYEKKGIKVISDCYNASPDSMRAALNLLHDIRGTGRKIAVLGDMLELGENSKAAHFEIGKLAANCADMLFTAGEFADIYADVAIAAGLPGSVVHAYGTVPELIDDLIYELRPGDTILVKGSRGMKMERVVEKIIKD